MSETTRLWQNSSGGFCGEQKPREESSAQNSACDITCQLAWGTAAPSNHSHGTMQTRTGLSHSFSLIPFCFYRCAVHGNEMISSSKHLSSERQTSFSQMHPSDKTCRIWAAGNLSESYFWIYYNQPYQLISYLQHINGEGKDKYIKTCHGNLKMVGVFFPEGKKSLHFYSSFNTSCTAWPLLLEDLNELPNHLNGISFIFIFLKL